MTCSSDKEAAKLFGLYLDHKVSLPILEECGKGMKVNVFNNRMSCIYTVWRAKKKIYAEAIYYKTVGNRMMLIDTFKYFGKSSRKARNRHLSNYSYLRLLLMVIASI